MLSGFTWHGMAWHGKAAAVQCSIEADEEVVQQALQLV
jgi:hypothetical protein